MSRLTGKFAELAKTGRKALIPFITAGDPNPDFTLPMMHAMVAAGVDIIELGVPFSDPMADGPVIQRASERALAHKMSLRKVLALVAEFRKTDQQTPVVLMGYVNPIEAMGYENFANAAQQADIDGVLTVDLPPDEAEECVAMLKARGIDPIFLLAPNSSDERIKLMDVAGSGYIYYVSLKGVTGAGHLNTADVETKLQQIRASTRLPIAIGFGVKDAETAKTVANLGDGVVVGSALISKIEAHQDDLATAQQQIVELLAAMRQAMDS
ncbi:MAG: tryptophan synthase subunit alpha [Methylococcaceae bacterium]|jgi:tryptophan synthase alpha chain|nr:tryptophan synthase subunit alpha [Methylococcaceae bacterium]MDZ4155850.1 tryptophan synthase subunit alpha [Methylococcales bacterium]MDP2391801.1 tryptophan synthase subunit alpha [Methylococcaceae bacterium]MDP3018960.1 tryptophan synthase subunit alpha [Methylococcaceae bacterium]MDP3391521.1 tryptophan synthase subunit alpha [Methylococcaceae bacterium]